MSRVDERLTNLANFASKRKSHKTKARLLSDLEEFLSSIVGVSLYEATPRHVCAFLAQRETRGTARTTIHTLVCPYIGTRNAEFCECPKQMKASTLKTLINQLKNALRVYDDIFERRWSANMGNPVDSRMVDDYSENARRQQQQLGVTVQKAVAMMPAKLSTLIERMRLLVRSPATPPLERVRVARDVAWFVIAWCTGVRGRQLGDTLLCHAMWVPEGEKLLLHQTAGKTMYDLTVTDTLVLTANSEPLMCPLTAMRAYLFHARHYISMGQMGFLFPQFNLYHGGVFAVPGPIPDQAINLRLKMYLDSFGIDAGETLHGFRSGYLINQLCAGASVAAASDGVWKSLTVAEGYAQYEAVIQRSGYTMREVQSMSADTRANLYARLSSSAAHAEIRRTAQPLLSIAAPVGSGAASSSSSST